MKKIMIMAACLILPLQAAEEPNRPKRPDAAPGETRKLLSKHSTVAEFTGMQFQPCRHLTALCPDKCTHAGQVASFKIIRYLKYEKPGKYGDPKAAVFRTMVEDQLGNAKVSAATLRALKTLQKGDRVQLDWNHDYVTRNGASFPVRTLTGLIVIKGGEC